MLSRQKIKRYDDMGMNSDIILELVETLDELEKLKVLIGCGCGICLAHNDMKCPKMEGKQHE